MPLIQDKKELHKKVENIIDIIGNHKYDGAQIVAILIAYYELNKDLLEFNHLPEKTNILNTCNENSSKSMFSFLNKGSRQ